jgi:AraC-like DNA-binding protein/multisubunit Na+/H+ antiporter MnhB subunit
LALLLLIGPLLKWYVLGMTTPDFQLAKKHLLELTPFVLVFAMSLFITKEAFDKEKWIRVMLASVLLFIYLHFAFYIFIAWRNLKRIKIAYKKEQRTKSQNAILDWLSVVIMGFVVIWISYFLNLIEDEVPYIIGPIVYSLTIYFLSYKAFQLNITDLDGVNFRTEDDNTQLFEKISQLIIGEKRYLESDLSLVGLSKLVGQSTQKTSSVINQYSKKNFNNFINYHRIQEAKQLLSDSTNHKFTISSIAFDVGFSSLSAFNSAFKKFENTTPSVFRKNKS